MPALGGVENSYGKVNILLQCYISQIEMESFSLASDLAYISQVCDVSLHVVCTCVYVCVCICVSVCVLCMCTCMCLYMYVGGVALLSKGCGTALVYRVGGGGVRLAGHWSDEECSVWE